MCPACIASAAVMAGSAISTGGIAAFAVNLVRRKKPRTRKCGAADNQQNEINRQYETERNNDHAHDNQQ